MDLLYTFLLIIHVTVCIFLILIVLLQTGKGAELGAAFGSVGQANAIRTSSTFIGKFTTGVAILFMMTSLSLAYLSSDRASSSVTQSVNPMELQKTKQEAAPTEGTEKQQENQPAGGNQ